MGSLTQPANQPAGKIEHFAMSTAPNGWLKANGAAVSRTAYAALFAAIGTTYGAGDGATTFALPDLRGEFVRGFDDGRGVDGGRGMGSAQSEALNFDLVNTSYGFLSAGSYTNLSVIKKGSVIADTSFGTENRPRNVAMLACIKY